MEEMRIEFIRDSFTIYVNTISGISAEEKEVSTLVPCNPRTRTACLSSIVSHLSASANVSSRPTSHMMSTHS
jgi:hypothetical protein